ncbi:MAG: hypothetical protein WDN26_04510 [Chitinophagaceae bacterium]
MNKLYQLIAFFTGVLLFSTPLFSQDSLAVYNWKVESKKNY